MPLVTSKGMVETACANGYAVAQINTNGGNYDLSRAILEAAQETRSPVILGVYESNAGYMGFPYLANSLSKLIEEWAPDVPVAIHLDHGGSYEVAEKAIGAGFTSIMYDGSKLPLEENISNSAEVCALVHKHGLTFEAELGRLLSGEVDPDNPNLVKVEEVAAFIEAVPVDMLAVAIGNSHGYYKGEPKLNMERLREVRAIASMPLVLHGTTGLAPEQVRECISLGMAKVNLGTMMRMNHVKYYQETAENFDHMGHPWRIAQEVKEKLKADCVTFLQIVGSTGKA